MHGWFAISPYKSCRIIGPTARVPPSGLCISMTDAKRNSVAEGKGPDDNLVQGPRAPARPGEQNIEEDFGYVFFPKRNPVASSTPQKSFWAKSFEMFSLGPYLHRRCLKNVVRCVEEDPFVRLMVAALKSRGW